MKCRVCGERFDETDIGRGYDEYPYADGYVRLCTHGVCPVCGAEEPAEEVRCLQCGEEVADTELKEGLCRFCAEELMQTLEWILSMLTPAQMRWMAEHPDWMERGDELC